MALTRPVKASLYSRESGTTSCGICGPTLAVDIVSRRGLSDSFIVSLGPNNAVCISELPCPGIWTLALPPSVRSAPPKLVCQ